MRMHLGGEWIDKSQKIEVLSPYDGSVVDTVPKGDTSDIEKALQTAERGAKIMAQMTGFERYEILHKVSEMMTERSEELARIITMEGGEDSRRGADRSDSRSRNHRALGRGSEKALRRSDSSLRARRGLKVSLVSRYACPAASLPGLARSIFRCISCATRQDLPSPPAMRLS